LITGDPALADQQLGSAQAALSILSHTVISVHEGDKVPFATGRAKFWLKLKLMSSGLFGSVSA
jgi:hypothetical protein